MPYSNREWNQDKFEKLKKEGRGQGLGKNYKPWVMIYDVPSIGRRARDPRWKTGRLHHVLSDYETRYFYLLEWADSVVDIREQYPLLDLETAQTIASDMGVKYPTDKKSGFPYVLTTDFFVTINNGQVKEIARTVKPSNELSRRRVIEKFEIERRYWTAKGVDWGIVTEHEISKTVAENVRNIHADYNLEPTQELSLAQLYWVANLLKERLQISRHSIAVTTTNLDQEMNYESGTCLRVFKHLLARKEVIMDMSRKINFTEPARSILEIVLDKEVKKRWSA